MRIALACLTMSTLAACAVQDAPDAHDVHTQRVLDAIEARADHVMDHKIEICHRAGRSGRSFIIEVDAHAMDAHVGHGDHVVGSELCDGVDNDCNGAADDLHVFEDFEDGTSMELVGAASVSGGVLDLTPVTRNKKGAAWLALPVSGDTFTASFSFETGGGSGADGVAFSFLDTDDTSAIGGAGGNLGIRGIGYDGYTVEFDTHDNGSSLSDPNGNHAAIAVADTLRALDVNAGVPTLENAGWFDVDIEAVRGNVEVWLDGTSILTTSLPSTSDTVQVGFSAGTGALHNRHQIDDFELSCPEFEVP